MQIATVKGRPRYSRSAGPLRWAAAALLMAIPGCQNDAPDSPQKTLGPDAAAEELVLVDLDGRSLNPLESSRAEVIVFLFARTDCPISNQYAPLVRRLVETYAPRGVEFYLVYPDRSETAEVVRAHLTDYRYPCSALRDEHHALVRLTGATITPEAAVFSRERRMVYRGRIDNRYVDFGTTRPEATTHELVDAIEATLAGRPVAVKSTKAVGCYIVDLQ